MQKRRKSIIDLLLILLAAVALVSGTSQIVAGGADFYLYQLQVYCGDPQVATVIFTARGPGSMGTKVICAGKCAGGNVTVEEAIAGIPASVATELRSQIRKHEENAAAGKGTSVAECGTKCNLDRYNDYLRKRQIAMDLFKHASDLRLTATKLVAERWGPESKNLGIEGGKEVGGDLAWQEIGPAVDWHLKNRRKWLYEEFVLRNNLLVRKATAAGRRAVSSIPYSVNAWNTVGWVFEAALTTRRGISTAADYADYQNEAQEATKQAEAMWREALAHFEAYLKQRCAEEFRANAGDRERLERAKAAIEEWDNNQNLYWDPIRNEAVTFSEAIRRANEYLKSGKISRILPGSEFVLAAFVGPDDPPDQKSLKAAIDELDKAIASWKILGASVSKYLKNQRSIERKLEEAFGVTTTTAATDAKKKALR